MDWQRFIQEGTKMVHHHGDLTKLEVGAIVNAANSSLLGGGGVDGAIHRAGGPAILEECRAIRARQGGCPTGQAVITTAGLMPAQYVIHTVGPVWNGGANGEVDLLANCYQNSLRLAAQHEVKIMAFPCISTGVYRFPKTTAAEIAVQEVKVFLANNPFPKLVIFVTFDPKDEVIYNSLIK